MIITENNFIRKRKGVKKIIYSGYQVLWVGHWWDHLLKRERQVEEGFGGKGFGVVLDTEFEHSTGQANENAQEVAGKYRSRARFKSHRQKKGP